MSASDLRLRRADLADVAAIGALAERAYAKWVPVLGRPPRPMIADYAAMLADHRIDLHEIDGRLVGSIATKPQETFLFVESVAVDPDWQGRGIGRALLAHAERLADEAGLREIRLLTNAKMEANAALYQRIGYVLVEREAHPVYGGVLHFSKALA
jgi:ribosomal protein S18 acetylase RimI-like enzyme